AARRDKAPAAERARRPLWGLSARLPRWRAFDGRRSRVAIDLDRTDYRGTHMKIITALAVAFMGATLFTACTREVQAMDAKQIEQEYGVPGAYAGTTATIDGPMKGTLVPITLANGRQGQ